MKKGFTLIELLAVIVILAIIALIATPIVLSIIEETKESAVLRSAEHYLSTVELGVAKKNLTAGGSFSPNTCEIQESGNLLCDGKDELVVELNGEVPSTGTITFNKGKITDVTLTLSNKTITKDENGKLVSGEALEEEKVLAPGLYDENDNLIASWADLTSMEYQTVTYDKTFQNEVTSAILNVDKNGVLTSTYSHHTLNNYSADYLVGKLVIDASVTSIGTEAFYECTSLTSITLPNSITSIGRWAFEGCTSLESITLPNSVTSIGVGAFNGCTSLTSIKVDSNNSTYDSRDNSNAIIETATNTLVVGCKNTVIPNSVTSIGEYAFERCTSLTNITIPDSVTSIGTLAFFDCENLATINYRGTEEQWNTIVKEEAWDEETPSNKVINYNYKG